jgi:hypothetical protein
MKTLKIILLLAVALLAIACNPTRENSITGAYVMSFKNEYSIATDTILIEVYNAQARTYRVTRRDGYHRIREGKILPKEYKQEHWLATYDENRMVLQENELGKQIYIKSDARSLDYGSTYEKIK